MKALFIMVAFALSVRFVYHVSRIGIADIKSEIGDWKVCVAALVDAFLIIAFAILEKGRW